MIRCRNAASALTLVLAVVTGTVVDRTTGQPLPGVTVASGNAHATSHADGSFRLGAMPTGHSSLEVSSDDVPPQRIPVTVRAKGTHLVLRVCSTTLDYNCGPPQ